MNSLTALSPHLKQPLSGPTIEDWLDDKGARHVKFERTGPFELNANKGAIQCELVTYYKSAYVNVKGHGNTAGDAFLDAWDKIHKVVV